jgi:hypothetical protein
MMLKRLLQVAVFMLMATPAFADCAAPDDGVTDATPAIQACINAAQGGGTVHLVKNATGIFSLQSAYDAASIFHISKPIKIFCDPGVYLKPESSITAAQSILYFFGASLGQAIDSPLYPQEQTVFDGCNIGDPNSLTRYGNHCMVFDTSNMAPPDYPMFKRLRVSNVMCAAAKLGPNSCFNASPTGCAIYAKNSSANTSGGIPWAKFDHSTLAGGVNLWLSGDSITLEHDVFPPNPLQPSAGNFGIYANLIPGAGNLVIDKVNCQVLSDCVAIDNAESATIRDVTFEALNYPNLAPRNTMIEIGISTLVPSNMVGAVAIDGGSVVSSDCTNYPYLFSYGKAIGGAVGGGVRLGHNCTSYPHSLGFMGVSSQNIMLGSIWWQNSSVTITNTAQEYTNYGTNNSRVVTTSP